MSEKPDIHELKTDSKVYWDVVQGGKNFEIRKNDRDFKVNDILVLRETENTGSEMKSGASLKYTGFKSNVKVKYILQGPIYGLKDGWVIMAIERILESH